MNITVLGCGALGQIWLSALSRQGHQVQGWLRVAHPHTTVHITSPEGEVYRHIFPANNPALLAETELLLVTLKAAQISNAIQQLLPRLPAQCTIVLMHNGMGVIDELPALNQPVLRAITTHSSYRSRGQVIHVSHGITHIGPVARNESQLSPLADLMHTALPDVAWHNDILPACWQKLAINCVINPLTIKYNCRNGGLLQHQDEIRQLCEELAAVMARANLHADAQQLQSNVIHVAEHSAGNYSSMLQDIQAGRSTEINYITGYLLRKATEFGIALPAHRTLYQLVKSKESAHGHTQISAGMPGTW
ncbi:MULTISPECIES: 2-dehydropantoate 2-reductase [unclassified Tatumella]|uniref:2-dehydropantoate 2-reductase n=1 Tax=unclassified Tatumella TaxID=2649542 RepID=UPI001BAEBA5B|nr:MULTISPECIES: 2-dehydropantoate 2-reductase [unclassified Tatumella]MBS0875758.1 2-dehydropantoate 2-reductase [Tatumella sp. JGM82]MBS0890163.1 2-dehydropantoate 2-reductase [Tatumella sp. JGM94]MBS0900289.1 2-dehydropantoate 2-reductase [Tatumella sp. JGM100]